MDNYFKVIWESCTSFSFYRKVTGLSFLQCLKYTAPFCLFVGALLYSRPGMELLGASRQLSEWAAGSLPEMRVEDGKLSVDAPQPCYLEPAGILIPVGAGGETRKLKLAFDTTGQVTSPEEADGADLLFLEDRMIVREPGAEAREIPFTEVWLFSRYKKITVNAENVAKYLPRIIWAMILLPFIVTIAAKPVQALVYSLFGMIAAARGGKTVIPFKGVYNICLFATIPATVVATVVQLLGLAFPPLYLMIFYTFVAVVFIVGAIGSIKQQA